MNGWMDGGVEANVEENESCPESGVVCRQQATVRWLLGRGGGSRALWL